MGIPLENQLEFYQSLNASWKKINETSDVEEIFDLTLHFAHEVIGFEKGIIFVHDESNGLFKVAASVGFDGHAEKSVLAIVQLLLSGEIIEHLRLTEKSLIHSSEQPIEMAEKLAKGIFLKEAVFDLFGGDIDVPYGLVVVGNHSDSPKTPIQSQVSQIALNNLFAYLSNSINNALFYRAWNEERMNLQTNIDIRTQQLQSQKENFEAIYQTSRDGIAILDIHTSAFLDANPAYQEMTGFSLDELMRTSCIALSAPEDVERSRQAMQQTVEQGFVKDFIKSYLIKDNQRITVNMSLALMNDRQRLLVTTKDITARIELEYELVKAKTKAEEATRVKGEFLANMSHEIRTPMNGILGITQLAMQHCKNQSQMSYLEKVHRSAESLLLIINDILDFSKAEAGKMQLNLGEFNLFKLIDSVIEMAEVSFYKKGVQLIVTYQPGIDSRVKGDALRLSQVLTNLISNAIKYTPEGQVKLHISQPKPKQFQFVIADTGIGMSESQQKRIFNPFYQVETGASKQTGGTGLGLVIAKQLVKLMNGSIRVRSQLDKGSTFQFTVELVPTVEQKINNYLKGKKVLLIENELVWQTEMTLRLTHLGGDVHFITSNEFLKNDFPITQQYDVIFADLGSLSPKFDAKIAFQNRLERLSKLSPNIVLLTSPLQQEDAIRKAKKAGMKHFLEKLLSPRHLIALCQTLCHPAGTITSGSNKAFQQPPVIPNLQGYSILLAEDNTINQELVEGLLEPSGAELDIAEDGKQALKMALEGTYDLILMDLQMPYLDGIAVTQSLRKQAIQVPIIAISANTSDLDIEKSLQSGMNDHLNKPINFKDFFKVLAKYLNKQTHESLKIPLKDQSSTYQSDFPLALIDMDPTLLDIEQGIAYMGGRQGLYLKILLQFIDKFEQAPVTMDPIYLHTLKGLSANIGAITVFRCVTDTSPNEKEYLQNIQAALASLFTAMNVKTWRQSIQSSPKHKQSASFTQIQQCFDDIAKAANNKSSYQCKQAIAYLKHFKLSQQDETRLEHIEACLQKRQYSDIPPYC